MNENNNIDPLKNREYLLKLANTRMPFGRFKNRLLIDLPEPYVVWFAREGFPKGELGQMLQIVYEIKVNGLEYLFKPLRGSK
ncbi:MAG: DUF3820 family protein [bacterium]|nr:DUF3820 family protein [bacterium]